MPTEGNKRSACPIRESELLGRSIEPERPDDREDRTQIIRIRVGGETDREGPVLLRAFDRDDEEADARTARVRRGAADDDRRILLWRASVLGRDDLGTDVGVGQLFKDSVGGLLERSGRRAAPAPSAYRRTRSGRSVAWATPLA
jgi:hypothetical protein